MTRVKVFTTGICPICEKTGKLLDRWGIPYDVARVDTDTNARREFIKVTNGSRSVPQITIDGEWIGSFTELTELHMEGKLEKLIES